MNRFFMDQENFDQGKIYFPTEITHQILHVLRLSEGDEVCVLDNQGHAYRVSLVGGDGSLGLEGEILSSTPVTTEPDTKVSLCFGLTSRDKVEWILQKGTEIGAAAFFPFTSERTLVQSTDLPAKKFLRWEKIIREAAEQSGRGLLPELNPPMTLTGCLQHFRALGTRLLAAWEGAEDHPDQKLSRILTGKMESLALFVGPEGGFSQAEVQSMQECGGELVSLGKRILRMETAAILFPALALQVLDDL